MPAYVAQADEAAIERLRTVEDVIIGWSLRKRSPDDKVRFGKWQRMAASEPSLVAGVISPKHRARPQSVEQVCLREGQGVEELWIACYTYSLIFMSHVLRATINVCYTSLQAGKSHPANLSELASSYIDSLLEVQQEQQEAEKGGDSEAGLTSAVYLLSEARDLCTIQCLACDL